MTCVDFWIDRARALRTEDPLELEKFELQFEFGEAVLKAAISCLHYQLPHMAAKRRLVVCLTAKEISLATDQKAKLSKAWRKVQLHHSVFGDPLAQPHGAKVRRPTEMTRAGRVVSRGTD